MNLDGIAGKTHQSDWLTIDQARIDAFADITGDHSPLHVDPVWAAVNSPYKATIAHGFLSLSMLTALVKGLIEPPPGAAVINYGLEHVRLVAPVPVGSRVRGAFTVSSAKKRGSGVMLTIASEIQVEGAPKPAVVAEWLVYVAPVA